MALRFGLRIGRQAAVVVFAAAAAVVMTAAMGTAAARARHPAAADKVYAAFFMGQGGYMFSWGVPRLEQEARKLGIVTRVYDYTDVNTAWADIARKRKEGYRIALVGYSLGNTTATYLQQRVSVDLLLAIAESSLGQNHPITKQNTRRAVLWWGPDTLSNAGTRDGFDVMNYVGSTHLLMDLHPQVVNGVLAELWGLAARQTPRRSAAAPTMVASRQVEPPSRPKHVDDDATASVRPAPQAEVRPPPVASADVTCTQCWGLPSGPGKVETGLFE